MIKIYKFYLDKDTDLNNKILGKMMRKFTTQVAPYYGRTKGYYDGTGQEIMRRTQADVTKPNNKIVKNYCATIVDNFNGYLTGKPITYTAKDNGDISALLDILETNDYKNLDNTFLRNALIDGVAYELVYVNDKNEKKFKNLEAENVIPIFANDLDEDLLYVVYFYPIVDWYDDDYNRRYSVNVYTESQILHYECDASFNNFTVSAEPEQHHFPQVPFVIFELNDDCSSIFERIISLQDAYNKILSDEVNDFESFVDAYMVLKNVSASAEDLEEMKQSRTILIDGEDEVSYLTKESNTETVQTLLDNINSSIHTVSNSPDFSSEEFNTGVSSGIALQYKLVGFNNIASNIESQMRKALLCRISLLNSILTLIDSNSCDVNITFTHNLPSNISDTVSMVNSLRGLVSDETLLAQIPFITDVDEEMLKVEGQYSYNTYNFSGE